MMKKYVITAILALVLMVVGCTYSVYQNSYPHLKTIRISPVANTSTEYTIEEDLENHLSSTFQSANMLKVVNIAPDCVLDVTINDYKDEVYGFNASEQVTERIVKILFSVQLTDLVRNETIFRKESLLLQKVYLPGAGSTATQPKSEEEARTEVWNDLYKAIMDSSFQSW